MKSGTIFGTSTEKALTSWIDKCRIKELARKSISSKQENSFSDRTSQAYIQTRETITDIVQQNRSISVELLYSKLPNNILANPSVRLIIFDMCNDGDIHLQSKTNPNTGVEGDFVLVFQKRKPKKQKNDVNKKYDGEFIHSNIEDVMDNNFYAKGRKLEFDYQNEKKPLNLNLKDPLKSSNKKQINRKTTDVRTLLENITMKTEKVPEKVVLINEPVVKKINQFDKIKSVDIFASQKQKIIEQPVIEITKPIFKAEIKPEPVEKIKKYNTTNHNVFDNYSAYDLYYLIEYLKLYIKKHKNKSGKYKYCLESAKIYAKIKCGSTTKKIISGMLGITIIFSFLIPIVIKNNDKKTAIFAFKEKEESIEFSLIEREFRSQFKNIFDEFKLN
ncbi:hypothetical protein [Spiroplasma endosymbiont of Aspidapion aeneum]|uniref:hypothetical protein n=1 Tax=Spiroplasma endosymbiont of Aspidapion aeneum TaxID=3066276 RepID=UPI00313BC402